MIKKGSFKIRVVPGLPCCKPQGTIHIVVYVTGTADFVKCCGLTEPPVKCYKWGPLLVEGVLRFRPTKPES